MNAGFVDIAYVLRSGNLVIVVIMEASGAWMIVMVPIVRCLSLRKNELLILKNIVAVILLAAVFAVYAVETEKDIEALIGQNTKLTYEMDNLQRQNNTYESQIKDLTIQIEDLTITLDEKQDKEKADRGSDRDPQLTSLGVYTVTAYCACKRCCGKYADKRPDGIVYGAAGVELEAGVSVAAWLPFGTEIMLNDHKYIVHDRTAQWIRERYDGRIIDLYFDSHEEAQAWGNPRMEVFAVR